MNPLSRIAGLAVDRALGLPLATAPYVVRPDVTVPMPDGVVLLGDHYRPAGHDRPLPVVLIRSPYGRAGLAGFMFAAPLARQGFQVFIQSTRGTFGSGGQFRPFLPERNDGLATVAWLRAQPWCDGQVSMTGGSYLGHTQWAIAPYVDPPLRSVSLNITMANFTAAFYQHGAPSLQNTLNWTGLVGRQERGLLGLIPSPLQQARMKRALRRVPLQAADVDVAGAPVAFWRDFVEHADLFVRVCDVDAEGVSRNIVDGIRRLSPQTVPAADVRVGDDGILAVDVELYPTAYRVQGGHRIRVQISGGAFPRYARNFGTPDPFGAATRALRCRFEIYHDSRHPACVVLPVLPRA